MSRNRGFTLTELLVVIAIIAILAAILFPILGKAKLMALRAQCASNLRQFGDAFSMYEQDWEGYWPAPGGLVGDRSYWSQTGSGGLELYINQRGVSSIWCCPVLKDWHGLYAPRTYSMNSYLRSPPDVEYPTCCSLLCGAWVENIEEPACTVLLYEGMHLEGGFQDSLDYIYRCANWSRVQGYSEGVVHIVNSGKPWHGAVNNYLYCDGHIKARIPGPRKTKGAFYSTWHEMREWYVSKRYFVSRYGEEP